CTCRNCSSSDHSTSMRAGRSLRLHTTMEPSLGSPRLRPCSACGRSLSAAMIAGAPFVKVHFGSTTPAAVAALAFRKRRRDEGRPFMTLSSHESGGSPAFRGKRLYELRVTETVAANRQRRKLFQLI